MQNEIGDNTRFGGWDVDDPNNYRTPEQWDMPGAGDPVQALNDQSSSQSGPAKKNSFVTPVAAKLPRTGKEGANPVSFAAPFLPAASRSKRIPCFELNKTAPSSTVTSGGNF